MTARPWMPLYIADYLADTAHLDAAQSGAYLHLIMHYWQHDGLPSGEQALMRIARMTPAQWKRERPVIAAFFAEGWRHKRIDAELAHAVDVSNKRRASAEQRHSKTDANAHAIADANAEQLDTHAGATSQSQSPEEATSLRSVAKKSPRDELETVLDVEHAKAVIEHRNRIRKPMTAHAARLLAGKLGKCPDPNFAADTMISAGWTGFEPEWMENRKPPPQLALNGNGAHPIPPKDDHEAETRLAVGRDRKMWPRPKWGPMPGEEGCLIPPNLLRPDDGKGWTEWEKRSGH